MARTYEVTDSRTGESTVVINAISRQHALAVALGDRFHVSIPNAQRSFELGRSDVPVLVAGEVTDAPDEESADRQAA